jgi:hypothetical protein
MLKWVKEQELCDAGIPDPLEGCTVHTKNWIRDYSCIDDSGRLITSSPEVTSVIEKAKTLTAKEKTGKINSAGERPTQRGHQERGISWSHKSNLFNCIVEGRVCGESHLYKKCKTQEIAHNAEETFVK